MQSRRFNRDIARREFTCYDCRAEWERGSELVFDNKRDCRICVRCLKKLESLLEEDAASLALEGKKPRWDATMGGKPWHHGDYDINSWSEDLQREYVAWSRSQETYAKGLARAQSRMGR